MLARLFVSSEGNWRRRSLGPSGSGTLSGVLQWAHPLGGQVSVSCSPVRGLGTWEIEDSPVQTVFEAKGSEEDEKRRSDGTWRCTCNPERDRGNQGPTDTSGHTGRKPGKRGHRGSDSGIKNGPSVWCCPDGKEVRMERHALCRRCWGGALERDNSPILLGDPEGSVDAGKYVHGVAGRRGHSNSLSLLCEVGGNDTKRNASTGGRPWRVQGPKEIGEKDKLEKRGKTRCPVCRFWPNWLRGELHRRSSISDTVV